MTLPRRAQAKVLSNRELRKGIRRMELTAPGIARCSRAGQFVMVSSSGGTAPLLPRPFSIHDRGPDSISILYRMVGLGTGRLAAASRNDVLSICGPLGRGFLTRSGRYRPVLVAGGMGLAPMPFLAGALRSRGLAPRLLYGCRNANELVKISGIRPAVTTDDGSCGSRGLVTGLLEKELARGGECRVFACGPWAMLRRVAAICRRSGVSCQVSLEARMACGVGACQGCAVRSSEGAYLSVCAEGPVFDSTMIDWEQEPPV